MLQGALDSTFDIFPHGTDADGIRVFPQDCGLLLKILAWEVQVRRLRASGAFIGHLLERWKALNSSRAAQGWSLRMRFCTITL